MVVGHYPPIKPKKYRRADKRMLALVKKAVKSWEKVVPIEYLSGIAYNFRMAQGPYLISTTQKIRVFQSKLMAATVVSSFVNLLKVPRVKSVHRTTGGYG
uniref:Uncharacterized protein n=1 Tax=Ditylenchus dipsaci TaxID=166011 RepID=A0A915CRS0_9BILA